MVLPIFVASLSLLALSACGQNALEPQTKVLYYSQFGARGNGITDDFEAIIATHAAANEQGASVRADSGATYYIGDTDKTAIIKTSTDFSDAQFVIDDSKVNANRQNWIFEVQSSFDSIDLTDKVDTLTQNQKRLKFELEYDSVVVATNSNVQHFIRQGVNADTGTAMQDTFLVSKSGKINSKTPIMWQFDEVTSLKAYPIDSTELKISGGFFTTVANGALSEYDYFARGIRINRSNVTVQGLKHYIKSEGDTSAPYMGFINISASTNVSVQDTVLTAHKMYYNQQGVSIGTYDITASNALNLSLANVSQTNCIHDATYWGIIATNYCKNVTLDSVNLSRFDAHHGVHNAKIVNSELGYMGISVVGSGILTVQNTKISANNFISLREDYGSTWNGEIHIINSVFAPPRKAFSYASILSVSNNGQHDFGYKTTMPSKIIIDGLHILDDNYPTSYQGIALISDHNAAHTGQEPHPYLLTSKLYVRGYTSLSGFTYRIPNSALSQNLKISYYVLPSFRLIVAAIVLILATIAYLAHTLMPNAEEDLVFEPKEVKIAPPKKERPQKPSRQDTQPEKQKPQPKAEKQKRDVKQDKQKEDFKSNKTTLKVANPIEDDDRVPTITLPRTAREIQESRTTSLRTQTSKTRDDSKK